MVVVLAMDIDEEFGDGFEHGEGDGVAVDGDGGAAGGVDAAGDEELAGVVGEVDIGGRGDA